MRRSSLSAAPICRCPESLRARILRGHLMLQRLFFELRYLVGRAPWDTGITPPEVMAFLECTAPGRALDLGCGTGTNAVEMARRGWEVTAIDFSGRAVQAARRRAAAARLPVTVVQGDVSDLRGVLGPFDFVLDIGCFHALTRDGQARYASHVSRRTLPGATFMLYTFIDPSTNGGQEPPTEDYVRTLFAPAFALTSLDRGTDGRHASAWFTFLRTS
jgi:cyclopropane fatty-acyl-phospholipid synthase-like methyltransferase